MSGAIATTLGFFAVGSLVGLGVYSGISANQGLQAQKGAMAEQQRANAALEQRAKSQSRKSQEAINAANRRSPDSASMLAAASQAAQSGPESTMLTGPQGVDPNSLALGRRTLLGG